MDEFELLESKITELLADVYSKMGCKETMTGNGQDYIGSQLEIGTTPLVALVSPGQSI